MKTMLNNKYHMSKEEH